MATIGREEFEKKLWARKDLKSKDIQLIMLAYRLSKYGHRGQKRDSGERYFEHPKRAALILMDELNIYDPGMIITALLHDIEEDTFILTWRDIEFIFGKRIERMVKTLTKDKLLPKNERDEKYHRKMQKASRSEKIVKLAEKFDNLRDMKGFSPERKREYIEETETIFLPMAKKVNEYLYQKIKKICEKYQKSC